MGIVYLMIGTKCSKVNVGSTITSIRKRFNNHKIGVKSLKGVRRVYPETIFIPIFMRQAMRGLKICL